MADQTQLTEDDEGKQVVNSHGDSVGRIVEVRGGTPYVDPDAGIGETLKSKLGWTDASEEDAYPLSQENVDTVTGDEVRLTH